MTVQLRPHHLLCLLTYAGKGYSQAFTANFDRVAARLSAGEDILVVDGLDDICAPLLADDSPHCRSLSVEERDAAALRDIGQLLGQSLQVGSGLIPDPGWLTAMRKGFRLGLVRPACASCEWSELCTEVAANGFSAARIR